MELKTNVREWKSSIDKFANLSDERLQQLVQGTTLEAHNAIFTWTPVVTGETRKAWKFEVAGKYLGRVWNNLPWIRKLEHGSSKQPGRGFMVMRALKFGDKFVLRAARKLGIK